MTYEEVERLFPRDIIISAHLYQILREDISYETIIGTIRTNPNKNIYDKLLSNQIWKIIFHVHFGKLYRAELLLKNRILSRHVTKWYTLFQLREKFYGDVSKYQPCVIVYQTNKGKCTNLDGIMLSVRDTLTHVGQTPHKEEYFILDTSPYSIRLWQNDDDGKMRIVKHFTTIKPIGLHHHHHQKFNLYQTKTHKSIKSVSDIQENDSVYLILTKDSQRYPMVRVNIKNGEKYDGKVILLYHKHKHDRHMLKFTTVTKIVSDNWGSYYVAINDSIYKWKSKKVFNDNKTIYLKTKSTFINTRILDIKTIDPYYLIYTCLEINECRSLMFKVKLMHTKSNDVVGIIYQCIVTNRLPIEECKLDDNIAMYNYTVLILDPFNRFVYIDLRDARKYKLYHLKNDHDKPNLLSKSHTCLISDRHFFIYYDDKVELCHISEDGSEIEHLYELRLANLFDEILTSNNYHVKLYYTEMRLHVFLCIEQETHRKMAIIDYTPLFRYVECLEVKQIIDV